MKNRKIQSTQNSTSKDFPFLPKKFQDRSTAEIYERYCQFLLGASKECIKQYLKFKKGRLQVEPTLSSKSYTAPATLSPTSSHPSTTKTEKKEISQLLVEYVNDYGGRFLVKDEITKQWVLADPNIARKKASQALRDSQKWKSNDFIEIGKQKQHDPGG